MSLAKKIARVQQAEQALLTQHSASTQHWQRLRHLWHHSWTPGRIVIAGLTLGFATGYARPMRVLRNSNTLFPLLRTLAPMLTSLFQAAAFSTSDDGSPDAAP
jgi:hypothetical protein